MGGKLAKLDRTVLEQHDVFVDTDDAFQQRARLLQALWRERRGIPIGSQRGRRLGSRVEPEHARARLSGFLTDTIREVVRHDALGPGRAPGSLIEPGRFVTNLLSSQPLCFNLFGELALDLELATRVMRGLFADRIARVTGILFEHSPGRRSARYTGDKSAFDVFVRYEGMRGARGFLAIEVKYHEPLDDAAAELTARHEEIADAMRCFVADRSALRKKPLQQIWRDHLLAGAMLGRGDYDEGTFVVMYPELNARCARAVAAYEAQLLPGATFAQRTHEHFVRSLRAASDAPWIEELHARYFDLEKAERWPVCPECGASDAIPFLFGEPTDEAYEDEKAGRCVLGGCCIFPSNPKWRCRGCGRDW